MSAIAVTRLIVLNFAVQRCTPCTAPSGHNIGEKDSAFDICSHM